jgi:hypothetical protein
MRFEKVFFSVRPIVLSLARSTMCRSTTFSSSRRRLQRAKQDDGKTYLIPAYIEVFAFDEQRLPSVLSLYGDIDLMRDM